ncbi:aldo/keto reductase [Porticoccaceae bacterium]|nr:aldo/keto reductase [Porticoccaceae bacterium]
MKSIELSDKVSISNIVYGMWRLTDDQDTSAGHIQNKIEACLEQGINTFDQADIYGGYTAEGLLGSVLKQSPQLRSAIKIITKCNIVAPMGLHVGKRFKYYDTTASYINGCIERSLTEMNVEYIDLLLLHRPNPLMDANETGAALDTLINSGKVNAVGVSNFRPWDFSLLQSRMQNPLVTNQIEISLSQSSAFNNGDLAFLQQHSVTPMAWSPLAGGSILQDSLSPLFLLMQQIGETHSVSPEAVAIAWLLRHPANIVPIMGSNRLDRIRRFDDASKVDLSAEEWFGLLEQASGHPAP